MNKKVLVTGILGQDGANMCEYLLKEIGDVKVFGMNHTAFKCNYYANTSLITSEYINSDQNGIKGNIVEFIPNINLKTGFNITYKNLTSNVQFTYLSQQYTDATNAVESNLSGVIGEIPAYKVMDFSLSYQKNKYKIESGVNNLLNESYFTRRATGYPGPGIIPSSETNVYTTIQIKI